MPHLSKQQRLKQQFPYSWRVRRRCADRFGQRCRVVVRGGMNSCLVQFTDGHQVVTSRNYIRRLEAWQALEAEREDRKW